MALYQQSSLTFVQAKQRVADSVGASGSSEWLTRAGQNIVAAFEKWNRFHPWNFLLTSHTGIQVVAPFTVASVTLSTTSTSWTATDNAFDSVVINDLVSGAGVYPMTTVEAISASASAITASVAASASGAVTLTFSRRDYTLPTDFGDLYTARLVSNPRTLQPSDTRQYDRAVFDQTTTSIPSHYSLFAVGETGKIRLIPTPTSADVLVLKYYRKMTIPSGDSDTLDIPVDWEYGMLAHAKAMTVVDRGGDPERAQYWQSFGDEALMRARAADQRATDAEPAFRPSVPETVGWNPNDVRPYTDV